MYRQDDETVWSRNWKWIVPVGCLVSFVSVVGIGSIVGFIYFVMSMMKSSGAYTDAVAKAKENLVVQESIGTPIEEGLFVTGSTSTSGTTGQADLTISISGPDGDATIYVVAEKSAGAWTFSTLTVEISDTGQRIDLLESKGEPSATKQEQPLLEE